jgi:hypothetical protein
MTVVKSDLKRAYMPYKLLLECLLPQFWTRMWVRSVPLGEPIPTYQTS